MGNSLEAQTDLENLDVLLTRTIFSPVTGTSKGIGPGSDTAATLGLWINFTGRGQS